MNKIFEWHKMIFMLYLEIIGIKFNETFQKDSFDPTWFEPFFLCFIPINFLGQAFLDFYDFTIFFNFSDLVFAMIYLSLFYFWIIFINQKQ